MTAYELDGVAPSFPDDGSHWVAPGTALVGDIALGRNVSIWFGTVIRGDNEPVAIGEGSNVQDNCVLHTDIGFPLTIGRDCTIGHLAMLHGCEIHDHALVGMGATVLNGARVGRNSVVGACSLVTEGKIVPDNALFMGAPARFVRWIEEDERDGFLEAARHYRDNIRRYRQGLVEIATEPA